MMTTMDDLADDLACKALDAAKKAGDEGIVDRVAQTIGASSTTMEEAFLTAIRIRRAERRARDYLASLA